VRADGRLWTQAPLAGLWSVPLADQAARFQDALAGPAPLRPAGYDLAFVGGTLRAAVSGLAIDLEGFGPVAVEPAIADPGLPAVMNLRQLVRAAVGRSVQLIGRFAGPRRLSGLALTAD
jgi:hypothetical protein